MADIILLPCNETYIRVITSDSIQNELHEHFSFLVEGYRFMPKFRAKMWDGRIHLFNLVTCTIYKGLISDIREFCEERNYSLQVDDSLCNECLTEFDTKHFFHDVLNVHSQGIKLTLKDFQETAFDHCITHNRSTIESPTASGKSLVIYGLARYYIDVLKLDKVLCVVPTLGLIRQMKSDFIDYSSQTDWPAEDNIHQIYQGQSKVTDKPIVISTWESIFKLPSTFFAQFSVILFDEVHQSKANSLKGIVEKAVLCKYRHGFSGSLGDCQADKLVIRGLFEESFIAATTRELMDTGHLANLKIRCMVLKHGYDFQRPDDYQEEIDFLVHSEPRNRFVCGLINALQGNTLVLSSRVKEHAIPLYERLKKNLKGRNVYLIVAKTEAEEREKFRKLMEKEDNAVLVGSYGTLGTGINIRKLHNMIFALGSKSVIRNLQAIGRSLRLAEGKITCTVYDIVDDLRKTEKGEMNATLKHFTGSRLPLYQRSEFTYDCKKITL